MKTTEVFPSHPERICWGCDRYCAADDLACGNGTIRAPHPQELFGKEWREWAKEHDSTPGRESAAARTTANDRPASPRR